MGIKVWQNWNQSMEEWESKYERMGIEVWRNMNLKVWSNGESKYGSELECGRMGIEVWRNMNLKVWSNGNQSTEER